MKGILKHPFSIALISCLLLTPIGNAIYDHTKNVPFLTDYILKPLSIIWGFILIVLKFNIPVYVLLISLFVLIVAVYLFARGGDEEVENVQAETIIEKPVPTAPFLDYKKDKISNWLWEWEYQYFAQHEKFYLVNVRPLCVVDETPLVKDYRNYPYSDFKCPRCQMAYGNPRVINGYNISESESDAKILIVDNIKKRFNLNVGL